MPFLGLRTSQLKCEVPNTILYHTILYYFLYVAEKCIVMKYRLSVTASSSPSLSNSSSSPSAPGPSSTGNSVFTGITSHIFYRYKLIQLEIHSARFSSFFIPTDVHELLCPESTFSEAWSLSCLRSSLWPSGCSTGSGESTSLSNSLSLPFDIYNIQICWFFLFPGWWNSVENCNTPTSSDMLPPSLTGACHPGCGAHCDESNGCLI